MSNYYVGQSPEDYRNRKDNYFYGLSRDDESGMIILDKINMYSSIESVSIQNLSEVSGNGRIFENISEGVDFFEGRSITHELIYDGLNYEQFKWDTNDLYYYVDEEGQLVVRINTPYNYPEGYTEKVLPEILLEGNPIDLGAIISDNPLENQILADLSTVRDLEQTYYAIDLGTIV